VLHSNLLSLCVAVPAAMLVYGIPIIVLKAVTAEELPDMPFGRKILVLARKLKLM
jgi:hypothetical protein